MQTIHCLSGRDVNKLSEGLHTIINQGRRIVTLVSAPNQCYLVISEPDNSDVLND